MKQKDLALEKALEALKKLDDGNWKSFREARLIVEVDFHHTEFGRRQIPYDEAMAQVKSEALDALEKAQARGLRFVLLTHGCSTSRPGKQTARSVIRGLMRNDRSTQYILRAKCLQRNSCFVAVIRPIPGVALPVPTCPTCGGQTIQPRSMAGWYRCRGCQKEFSLLDLAVTD